MCLTAVLGGRQVDPVRPGDLMNFRISGDMASKKVRDRGSRE